MTMCSLSFVTLLKMAVPIGIIRASSVRASNVNSSSVGLSLRHKNVPWVRIKHTESATGCLLPDDGTEEIWIERNRVHVPDPFFGL